MEKIRKITDYQNPKAESEIRFGRTEKWWNKHFARYEKGQRFSSKMKLTIQQNDVKQLVETYNLKGLEFGNWMTQADREDAYLCLRWSLHNLEDVFGKNIGFDTHIGIAVGARGLGGKALAHYEPLDNMINLTKTKGAGCLAHEYGHALDYNFGTYLEQSKFYCSLSGGIDIQKIRPLGDTKNLRYYVNYIVNFVNEKNGSLLNNMTVYWRQRNEIFARTFEQLLAHKIGYVDEYLYKSTAEYERLSQFGIYLKYIDVREIMPKFNIMVRMMKQELEKK